MYYSNSVANVNQVQKLCDKYSTDVCTFYVFEDDNEEDPVSEIGYTLTRLDNTDDDAIYESKKLKEAAGSNTIRCMVALYEDDDGYVCKVGVYAGDLSVEEMEDLLTEQGMSFVTCWDEYEYTTSNTYNLGDVVEVFDVEDEDIEDIAAMSGKDPEEYKNVGFF